VLLQAAAAAAVLGFFRNRPDRHWWKTGPAPLLGPATALVLIVANCAELTDVHNAVINSLPWLFRR
jgi:hypothetical protein